MKEIYDKVYDNFQDYDEKFDYKIELINQEFEKFSKDSKIIDIGCGKGHYIKHLINSGYKNILGIEFSSVCSEKYLQGVPHLNVDFLKHCESIKDKEYEICLCMDVLEHIPYDKVEYMVANIARIGNKSILGIANHSDIFLGEELHIIQEDYKWWTLLLQKYFNNVEKIYDRKGKFYLFRCS